MRQFTLEYWKDDDWYVGRLKEVPGVFSQGETVEELEENVKDAYRLMMEDDTVILSHTHAPVYQKEIGVDI
jgi:predicted RNase H-like HicB family nuclease